jgi:signal recognition particle subunit SRP54
MADKILRSGSFDFNDLLEQIQQMESMGGMQGILSKLPGMGGAQATEMLQKKLEEQSFDAFRDMIRSMTLKERAFPALVMNVKTRQKRIIDGSGRSQKEFKAMLKQFQRMQKMASKLKGKNLMGMMNKMQDLFGGQR